MGVLKIKNGELIFVQRVLLVFSWTDCKSGIPYFTLQYLLYHILLTIKITHFYMVHHTTENESRYEKCLRFLL